MSRTRVVVLLSDSQAEPVDTAADGTSSTVPPASTQYGGEVSILEGHTVRLLCCQNNSEPHVLVAEKLRFDCLSSTQVGNKSQTEQELASLMNCLFVEQRDSVLLHLTSQESCYLMFLAHALVTQVNQKLQEQNLILERGSVRYVQLLDDQPMMHLSSRINSTLETAFSFYHTNALLNWLLNEYRLRAARAPGQEVLDVSYYVTHMEKSLHFSVKVTFMFVNISKLSLGSLCSLRSYFSDDIITAALACTPLTTYLRVAMARATTKPIYLLLLCHILVTGKEIDAANLQLLGLAHLACRLPKLASQCIEMPISKSSNRLAHSKQLKLQQQQLSEGFEIMQNSLLQYRQLTEQLFKGRQQFYENLANFEKLSQHIVNAEFSTVLRKMNQ